MSFKSKDLLRKQIRDAAEKLRLDCIPQSEISKRLADHFGNDLKSKNPVAMVNYYLRDFRSDGKNDRRIRYTKHEQGNLLLLTPKELEDYATHLGRSYSTVYSAMRRTAIHLEESVHTEKDFEMCREDTKKSDFLDFSRSLDLKAHGLTLHRVRDVRTILAEKCGLALRVPNILYQPVKQRRYYMNRQEQLHLLADPIKFLKFRIDHIHENWVYKDVDPIADDVVDPLTRKAKPRRKSSIVRSIDRLVALVAQEAERFPVLQHGSEKYNEFVRVRGFLTDLIDGAAKPFDPTDPTTYVDLVGDLKVQTDLEAVERKVQEDRDKELDDCMDKAWSEFVTERAMDELNDVPVKGVARYEQMAAAAFKDIEASDEEMAETRSRRLKAGMPR